MEQMKKVRKPRKKKNPNLIRQTVCVRLLPKHLKVLKDKSKRSKKSLGKIIENLIWGV